jgi:hypothetical protein
MIDLIELQKTHLRAKIYKGILASIPFNGKEYFHGASLPEEFKKPSDRKGWDNSEITMFPIVGPAGENYIVEMDGERFQLDQHGISRVMPFLLKNYGENYAIFEQKNHQGNKLKNPKYKPENDHPRYIRFPRDFTFTKRISIDGTIEVTNIIKNDMSNKDIFYHIGAHPSPKTIGKIEDSYFEVEGSPKISLVDVITASKNNGSFRLPGVSRLKYVDKRSGHGIEMKFKGYRHAALWSPSYDAGMFSIEPMTCIPGTRSTNLSDGTHEHLVPLSHKTYTYTIKPF